MEDAEISSASVLNISTATGEKVMTSYTKNMNEMK